MGSPFSNIDQTFKNAFEHFEAPHSPAEMNAGWEQVAHHLPHLPGAHTPSAGHVAGHFAGSIGKIIGFTGLGAAVLATAVVLYNIYVAPVKPAPDHSVLSPTKTEQPKPGAIVAATPDKNRTSLVANPENATGQPNGSHKNALQSQPQNNSPKSFASNPFGPSLLTAPENLQKQNPGFNTSAASVSPKPQSTVNQVQNMKLFLSDTVICTGVQVAASSNISYPGVVIEWGDGKWNFFDGKNVHTYMNKGVFRAHLTIDSIRADRIITVLATPKARFTEHQGENMNFVFANSTINGNSYEWNFGDGGADELGYYPNHTYTDTGLYKVRLVAVNSTGCADTTYQNINVQQVAEPKITSNAITPNGDGMNDNVGVTIEGETSFQFTIADRTGQTVFQTSDKGKRWGGQNQFTGADCKAGTYYYTIIYGFKQNMPPIKKTGSVNLIRSKN